MKPYGVPRYCELDFPDVGTIKEFGLKSAIGKVKKKGDDRGSYFKRSHVKRATRRYFKRLARRIKFEDE